MEIERREAGEKSPLCILVGHIKTTIHMPTHPYIGYPKRKRNEIPNPYDATLRVWKQEKRIENNKRKYVKKKKM